jgi:D-proline reductase (dithiol) PrdB
MGHPMGEGSAAGTMGTLNEFSIGTRLFLKAYPWRRIDPVPWAPLHKPLAQSRLALVSSAGFVTATQKPFDESVSGGDFSFRDIPSDVDIRTLVDTHRSESFDHTGLHQDPNLAFPIDRMRELAAQGRIGSINHRHLSCMGSITAPGRLVKQTAPEAARSLVGDGVDVALLVPV